jgi:hypothetical protein
MSKRQISPLTSAVHLICICADLACILCQSKHNASSTSSPLLSYPIISRHVSLFTLRRGNDRSSSTSAQNGSVKCPDHMCTLCDDKLEFKCRCSKSDIQTTTGMHCREAYLRRPQYARMKACPRVVSYPVLQFPFSSPRLPNMFYTIALISTSSAIQTTACMHKCGCFAPLVLSVREDMHDIGAGVRDYRISPPSWARAHIPSVRACARASSTFAGACYTSAKCLRRRVPSKRTSQPIAKRAARSSGLQRRRIRREHRGVGEGSEQPAGCVYGEGLQRLVRTLSHIPSIFLSPSHSTLSFFTFGAADGATA